MNRTLKNIELKWYHIKTLEKFFKLPATPIQFTDADDKEFQGCQFHNGWRIQQFLTHPKTGRCKLAYNSTFSELGFKFKDI